ncbi:MAG: uroporphyrinogen-III C-methyltransferase [Candidatus Contendobacter sp.]|nr:uroporphyrinogen-III C-methyltransferase [Candidatus Contendobacter sp.]
MTDQTSDNNDKAKTVSVAKATPTTAASPGKPLQPDPAPAPAPKSGRGVAWLALLVGLGAGGGSGYLWYLWQRDQAAQVTRLDQAIKQAVAQRDPEFQALKAQVQQLQGLKTGLDQARADQQALREQLLGLTGDLQPLKNAMELHKGENEIIKGEMKLLRESHETHKSSVQKQHSELSAQLQGDENRLAKQNEQLQNLRLGLSGLTEQLEIVKTLVAKGGDVNAFPLAEVDYLLRLADTKLKLERNVPAARLALEVAQQRLKAVNESAMAPVQTMLGETIASLRGVKLPDFSALAHKVAEMQKEIGGLPLRITSGVPDIKNRVKPAANATVSTDTERPWWERGSEAVWNQFKDIVVIRRVRSDAPPLIAMEEEFFLRQNLRLELESLRTALLRGDAEAYRDSHDLIDQWTQQYFDTEDKRVIAFLAELKALQTVEFNPYIPDLTGLNQAFGEAMSHRQPIRTLGKAPAAPVEPATTSGGAQP